MNLPRFKPNIRLTALAGLLLLSGSFSTARVVQSAPAPKKIMMWKAVNGPNIVYLLGSIHLGSPDMYPLPKPIDDAFNRSKAMVVEVNIENVDMGSMMQQITDSGMYKDGDTLWAHLSPKTTEKVKKLFAHYNFPTERVGMMKPWLVGIMASVLPMMSAGMAADLGIDKHFLDLATGKKKIEQAESMEFQLKVLSSLPDSAADSYLSWTIGEIDRSKSEELMLEKLWKSGNAEALAAVITTYPKELVHVMRSLLEDRNPHMADIAEKYLKGGGPCFFVVGAGHLVGEEGVVAILQRRGYQIYQMNER